MLDGKRQSNEQLVGVKKIKNISLQDYGLGFLCVLAIIFLAYIADQVHFWHIIFPFSILFVTYWYIMQYRIPSNTYFYIRLAVIMRIIILFSFPNLSDDIYRFVWDGRLINAGINPFNHLPSYFLDTTLSINGIDQNLYAQLNSPDYYTIYPPLAQGIFALATWLFPNSIYGSALIMKSLFCIFEIASIVLIIKILDILQLPRHQVGWYALNPLIIIEITGNLHAEGVMVFFFLLAWYLLLRQRYLLAALSIASSIAAKLLPLLFLPFLVKRLPTSFKLSFPTTKRSYLAPLLSYLQNLIEKLPYFIAVFLILIVLFIPLFNDVFIQNISKSLDLYFRKFEFNGSVYYLLRYLGYQWVGYNMIAKIGPFLGLCTFGLIIHKAIYEKEITWLSFPLVCLFAISIYLLFATTVHPWYLALPIVLCSFTNYRFPIIWSALIILTYFNYQHGIYKEHLWIVALEYLSTLLFFLYEYPFSPLLSNNTKKHP